jgi:hypothetical protein
MISYQTANMLLEQSSAAPYWFGFAVYLAAGLAAMRFMTHLRLHLEKSQPAGATHGG